MVTLAFPQSGTIFRLFDAKARVSLPSRTALASNLYRAVTSGEPFTRESTNRLTSSQNRSRSHTRSTSPVSKASLASITFPDNKTGKARPGPIFFINRLAPPHPEVICKFTWIIPNRAESEDTQRSQLVANSHPPPTGSTLHRRNRKQMRLVNPFQAFSHPQHDGPDFFRFGHLVKFPHIASG